ncbi:MAG: STAS domain-containing protein [Bacteroidales bacterium]|jgi:anti-anti-sigma factor|nr:STAS domain-containing protein [Bacteroidales bacterium]MBQ2514665.1 STAS domain-containing protein [Bacteroidales bacterium]MBR4637432.1 STAS domain-containing protein [Bacteroidales bacterium]MBR5919760.1 STAS domain-containing protein [Bacteroidales bacterium]MBR6175776.1 STAS domain-containing protein [Bacteroidales bacterium]
MEITINKQDNKTLVVLNGRIDTTNADQFQQDMAQLMEEENPDIDIDCTEMSYTSSQGLRIFLMLQKSVMQHGGKMVMRNMNPQVKEVFDITGFSNIITIV